MTILFIIAAVAFLIVAIRYGFIGPVLDILFAILGAVTGGKGGGSSSGSSGSGFGGGDSGGGGASSDY